MVVFNGATTGIIGQMGGTVWAACSMIRTKSNVTTRNRTQVSPLTARYGYRLRHGRSRNDGMTEVEYLRANRPGGSRHGSMTALDRS